MCKIKKLTAALLVMAILFGQAVWVIATSNDLRFRSNRFTQPEPEHVELINYNNSVEGFDVAASNDYLTLYVNTKTLAIKVRNEVTGYLWSSTLDEKAEHQLNESWRNFVESAVTIDFVATGGNVTRESLTSNNSVVNFTLIEDGFSADIVFDLAQIELQLVVTIQDADLIVSILDETISEPEDVQLVAVQLYPFLAATKEDHVPGYMFIPDGAGALIRFGEQEVAMNSPFRSMIYGHDLGMGMSSGSLGLNEPHEIRMPVYGMVHGVNQNALLTIVESGDNYGEIIAHTAGLFTEFNWITTMFHYRQTYNQQTTRDIERGPSIQMLQAVRNNFDIVMRHRILSDTEANYVGMALSYQRRLVELGILRPLTEPGSMMRLEFLGAEMQEGLLWDTVVAMTPVEDILMFINRLQNQGLQELMVVYRGWMRGGISNSLPNRTRFEGNLGSVTELQTVIDTLANDDILMYFYTDYTRVDRGANRLFGGPRLAQQINSRPVGNVLIPRDALSQAHSDIDQLANLGIKNFAVETTATSLYSTFNEDFTATRSQNANYIQELIAVLNDDGTRSMALYEPNVPFWQGVNHHLDIPMSASGYLFATDTVPFLHIVLRGYVNYYAPVSNFWANSRQQLLRIIDFGAYPSFLLTSAPSHLLADTPSRDIFTSEFDVWEATVVEYYQLISEALGQVRQIPIASREVLAPGIVEVTYENDVRIIVNYTQNAFSHNGVYVEAENFLVWGGR